MKPTKKISLRGYNGKYLLIKVKDLVYCKSSANYTEYHTTDGNMHVGNYNIAHTANKLPTHLFFRVRRELLVNVNHIVHYHNDGSLLLTNGFTCTIAIRNLKEFQEFIKTHYYIMP